jgi:hypothetical protein
MAPTEQASGYESISPIIAFAAHHGYRPASHGPIPLLKAGYDAGPSAFHQGDRRDMGF